MHWFDLVLGYVFGCWITYLLCYIKYTDCYWAYNDEDDGFNFIEFLFMPLSIIIVPIFYIYEIIKNTIDIKK